MSRPPASCARPVRDTRGARRNPGRAVRERLGLRRQGPGLGRKLLEAAGELRGPGRELVRPVRRLPGPIGERRRAVRERGGPVGELTRAVHELLGPARHLVGAVDELLEPVDERAGDDLRAGRGAGEVCRAVRHRARVVGRDLQCRLCRGDREQRVDHVRARHAAGCRRLDRARHLAGHRAQRIPRAVVRDEAERRPGRRAGGVAADRGHGPGEVVRDREHGGVPPVTQAGRGVGGFGCHPREPAVGRRLRERCRDIRAQRDGLDRPVRGRERSARVLVDHRGADRAEVRRRPADGPREQSGEHDGDEHHEPERDDEPAAGGATAGCHRAHGHRPDVRGDGRRRAAEQAGDRDPGRPPCPLARRAP